MGTALGDRVAHALGSNKAISARRLWQQTLGYTAESTDLSNVQRRA